ncbi:unnamed protein product [marine sediment metagenome]|uniref:DUF3168 domain-containing protein n=1 Tax=marine sediment metagenome TaxID=412755 RepID=X1EPX4_9ZZZZ
MSVTELWQAIGYKMLNTEAITDIVSTRIHHGRIPEDAWGEPVINYFEVANPNTRDGAVECPVYQISCRSKDPGQVQELAQVVAQTFHLMQESVNGFAVQDAHFQNKQLLFDPDVQMHHVPVELRFIIEAGG